MGSCIDECILLDLQSCICPWWPTQHRRHRQRTPTTTHIRTSQSTRTQQQQIQLYLPPQETPSQLTTAEACSHPPVIRFHALLSLNLLLLNLDQLATTPPPERFTERSAAVTKDGNFQRSCNHLQIPKSIAADVSRARGFRGRDSASRDLKKGGGIRDSDAARDITAIRSWNLDV
jgi:hypothetical protein